MIKMTKEVKELAEREYNDRYYKQLDLKKKRIIEESFIEMEILNKLAEQYIQKLNILRNRFKDDADFYLSSTSYGNAEIKVGINVKNKIDKSKDKLTFMAELSIGGDNLTYIETLLDKYFK